jgi:hypothetical protein
MMESSLDENFQKFLLFGQPATSPSKMSKLSRNKLKVLHSSIGKFSAFSIGDVFAHSPLNTLLFELEFGEASARKCRLF